MPHSNRIANCSVVFRRNRRRAAGAMMLCAIMTAASLWLIPSCAIDGSMMSSKDASVTLDQQAQAAITPDAALQRLMEGNHRFITGQSLRRDYVKQVKATASGQYPFAVVLSCLDSRSGPEIVF